MNTTQTKLSTSQTRTANRQITLASRPNGEPKLTDFKLVESAIPDITEGQVLLRTVYLSLDPYMRGRMSDAESYADPVAIDDVMVGGSVCRVEQTLNDKFKQGDWVVAFGGWQDYCVSDGVDLLKLPEQLAHKSYALGILGMPGLTAYMGLMDIGQPQGGETVVVAAATGAVGSLVGQIAKLNGCHVVGIAGGAEKCDYAVNELGFDVCVDHKSAGLNDALKLACPNGIDVYFENVGGAVFDAVLPLLNTKARVPLCGLISQYNATSLPDGPDRIGLLMGRLLVKRIKMQGFIVFDDYGHRYSEFSDVMSNWLQKGEIKYKEHLVQGLDNSPEAFIGLLKGENFGKLVIQVGSANLTN